MDPLELSIFRSEFYFISFSLLTSSQKGIWTRIRVPSVQDNRNTGSATGLNVVQGIYFQVDKRGYEFRAGSSMYSDEIEARFYLFKELKLMVGT